jgi:hypothetical protein
LLGNNHRVFCVKLGELLLQPELFDGRRSRHTG